MAGRIQIRFVPQPAQMAYIDSPADITVFGGARGGGKTYASLGDFWLHAEDHGKDARGLMVRKTRTDLKDTIHTAINLYGNAASWREHGAFFDFRNGARLMASWRMSATPRPIRAGSRAAYSRNHPFSSLDPMMKAAGDPARRRGSGCQIGHLQPWRPAAFRGQDDVYHNAR
jgi:hypothetical protein